MATASIDSLGSYLKEIGRYDLLTKEEELTLSSKVQAAFRIEQARQKLNLQLQRKATDLELSVYLNKSSSEIASISRIGKIAKEKMIKANLRLVVSIAKKYQGRGMDLQDLIQEGTIGLSRGVEKFDAAKGYKLSTYAYWWITQSITRAISQDSRAIRLPVNLTEKINKIKKACRELSQSLGRYPNFTEIAQATGFNVEKIEAWLKYSRKLISLDMSIGKNEDSTLIDFIESDDIPLIEKAELSLLRDNLNDALSGLTMHQRDVIVLRYGIDSGDTSTLSEVSRRVGFSRERCRQIELEALQALRKRHLKKIK